MDVLCFSSTDWHGKWGSRQQVMVRLARRGHRVLFVEWLAGLEHFWRYPDLRHRRPQRWREGLEEVEPGLWVLAPPPLLPGRYYLPAVARLNAELIRRWLRPHVRRLKMPRPILWLYQPEHGPLIGRLNEQLTVYHCIDEFAAGISGHKHRVITTLEARLLARADIVFANSLLTFQRKVTRNPNTYRIPSGADVEHFGQALDPATPVHAALATIPHPIAGTIGNVNNKLDIQLLADVAALLRDWRFVFVGQIYPRTVDLRPLQELPNVHLLGRFPFAELPGLVKGMDVCLLPYAETEFTRYRSPLKLYEYMAAGKSIISTNHPEARELSKWVRITSIPSGFASALVEEYEHDSPDKRGLRASAAQEHSWDHLVDDMERIVIAHLRDVSDIGESHAP
jgi:glycosyltransferase involved in cell wall biosynthesis